MSAGPGHNSGGIAAAQLRQIVERIERLEEEAREVNGTKSDVYQEAKGNGFDVKIIKKIVAMRRKPETERVEEQSLLDLYMHALGMLPSEDEPEPAPEPAAKAEPLAHVHTHARESAPTIAGRPTVASSTVILNADSLAGVQVTPTAPAPSPPGFVAPAASADPGDIPAFLRRGHPDCIVEQKP